MAETNLAIPDWQGRIIDSTVRDITSGGILRSGVFILEPDNARAALFEEVCAARTPRNPIDYDTLALLSDNYIERVQDQTVLALSVAETTLANAGVETHLEDYRVPRLVGSLVFGYEVASGEYLMNQWDDIQRGQPVMRDYRELTQIERSATLDYQARFDVQRTFDRTGFHPQAVIYPTLTMHGVTSVLMQERVAKWMQETAPKPDSPDADESNE